jgi:hypothetical protein
VNGVQRSVVRAFLSSAVICAALSFAPTFAAGTWPASVDAPALQMTGRALAPGPIFPPSVDAAALKMTGRSLGAGPVFPATVDAPMLQMTGRL